NFNAQPATTGGFENAAFGIDAFRRVIRFPAPHLFQTGDAVWYDPKGNTSLVGGLNDSTVYYVRVLDPYTIQLFGSRADPMEGSVAIPAFPGTPSSSGVESDNKTIDTDKASGTFPTFTNGEAVTYQAQTPAQFTTGGVDVDYQTNSSGKIVKF